MGNSTRGGFPPLPCCTGDRLVTNWDHSLA